MEEKERKIKDLLAKCGGLTSNSTKAYCFEWGVIICKNEAPPVYEFIIGEREIVFEVGTLLEPDSDLWIVAHSLLSLGVQSPDEKDEIKALKDGIRLFIDFMRTDAVEFGMGVWVDRLCSLLKPDGYWKPNEFRRQLVDAGVLKSPAIDEKDAEIADLKAANDALQGVHEGDLKALEALRELKSLAPSSEKDPEMISLSTHRQVLGLANHTIGQLRSNITYRDGQISKLIEALENSNLAIIDVLQHGDSQDKLRAAVRVNSEALAAYKGKEGETT